METQQRRMVTGPLTTFSRENNVAAGVRMFSKLLECC